jgi:hypothetical protein
MEHLSAAQQVACGLRALPSTASAMAATQAAYRFYHNPRIRLPALMEPLLAVGRQALAVNAGGYALVLHDWSNLHFNHHDSKADRVSLSRSFDLGYELQAAIVVDSQQGQPLAPVSLSVRAADGVHCSRWGKVRPPASQLDELEPVMEFVERQRWNKPAVHIVDAEADSVGHYRSWLRVPGRFVIVRADDRLVQHEEQERRFSAIFSLLWEAQQFRRAGEVKCRGRQAMQWIAETTVTITSPARPHRRNEQPRRAVPGPPVTLRLVISRIQPLEEGAKAEVWYLLTNLPAEVSAEQVALWYYWRWQIESYFKLLKSAGQQLEHWQKESAAALTRRLLVASMACVLVWQLAHDESPAAEQLRHILIRLSGRQMKYGRSFTMPALLAGLWTLLSMLALLEQYDLSDLQQLVATVLARAGPPSR